MKVFIQINGSYETRVEKYDGEDHLVVPVIMMVEGVHAGSGGPMLHLAEDLGRYPETWNGIPVVVSHPSEDGQYISANSPGVLDAGIVGRVFNTKMDGEKLKSEVWLNQARLEEVSPEALQAIQDQVPLDVSVGVFSDAENVTDTYKGETYESIARNFRPDHLALLPGEEGACSWSDGCGIRANSDSKFKKKGEENVKAETLQMIKGLNIAGYSISEIENYVETGYKELIDQVWSTLQVMGNDNVWYYLEELYDDYLVYAKSGQAETQLYKQNYKNSDGTIEFVGDPVEVRKDVKFVVMKEEKRSGLTRTRFSNNNKKEEKMSKKEETPCCEDLVNELIVNKRTPFEEKDKEQLLTLSEELLGKLIPEKEAEVEPKKEEKKEVQANAEPEKESVKTPDEIFKTLPADMQESMNYGSKLYEAEKAKMMKVITDNHKDTWPEVTLKAMDMETLTRVYKMVPAVVDYSANTGGGNNDNDQEALYPAGVEINKE